MTAVAAMIEAPVEVRHIRRAYDFYSFFYGRLMGPLEKKARMRGLDRAAIRPGERVLEVAVGPGATLVEIVKRAGQSGTVSGVDLSPKMLAVARERVRAAGFGPVDLREADARRLPFAGDSFDVLYNSYMLDLIPLAELPGIVREFRRVLRPGGRLVLVNLSKEGEEQRTWLERLYSSLPPWGVSYLMGGCRPVVLGNLVRQEGFVEVRREFMAWPFPSEIVSARKGEA